MLGWEEHSGHLCMGLSKIKEAQGAWLSLPQLSLCGNLSIRAPGSGQEFDSRNCFPQLDVAWWGCRSRWDCGRIWWVRKMEEGLRMLGRGLFPCNSASLL